MRIEILIRLVDLVRGVSLLEGHVEEERASGCTLCVGLAVDVAHSVIANHVTRVLPFEGEVGGSIHLAYGMNLPT